MQMIYYGDSLEHHGVKGQRWGIRRYQPYPNGSKKGRFIGKKKKGKPMSEDAKYAKELRKKHRDELTNQELRALNERTQLEQNYKRLNPNKIKKGVAVVGAIAGGMGTIVTLFNNSEKLIKIGKGFVAGKAT